MRVLTVCNLYPPQAIGGYERSCADVMEGFRAAGHDVHVLTTNTRFPGVADTSANESDVSRDLRWYWRDYRVLRPNRWRSRRIDEHNRRCLQLAITRHRPDVISLWAMGGLSMSLVDLVARSGIPSVWVVCDEWPVYGPRMDAWRARHGAAAPIPGDAALCWVSAWLRQRVLSQTGWQTQHEVVTGSGIDERDFPVVREPDERPWRWSLLAVGRVEPRKGFTAAVQALAHLPETATLRIAGPEDGTHASRLRDEARRLGIEDHRLRIDSVPRDELAGLYRSADTVLFTSAWSEPFGLVPLEAMACGTPVVAMPTGGAAEFLTDGENCLTVPQGDGAAMAAAVRRLADEPDLRRRLITAGLTTARHYTVRRLTRTLLDVHEDVGSRKRTPA